jgi:hypothetical protein
VISQWNATGTFTGAVGPLTAGQKYDIKLEYREATGSAKIILAWTSPSFPMEVIDALTLATEGHSEIDFADGVRIHTAWQNTTQDANGWPQGNTTTILNGNYDMPSGRYAIRFKGKAAVTINGALFDATTNKTLAYGTGHTASNNTTEATFTMAAIGKVSVQFTSTSRAGSLVPDNNGITELEVMRPEYTGSMTPLPFGAAISGESKEILKSFNAFRWQSTGLTDAETWSQRTLPTYSHLEDQFVHNQDCYETLIQSCNEAGRDFYLNYGTLVDHDFMKHLAQLVRYGSDANGNVYTNEVANPYHPPLNPNLRWYTEHGNEQSWSSITGSMPDFTAWKTTDDGRLAGFDGGTVGDKRWHATRTVRFSQICRDVFGDEAMGDRVRTQIFGQYESTREYDMLEFINDCFNNTNHVPNADWPYPARPVNQYIWGSGAALYAASANNWGEMGEVWITNGGFEAVDLADGTAALRPTNTTWTFTGNAGVCDVKLARQAMFSTVPDGTPGNSLSQSTWVGMKIQVGANDVYVYEIGRLVHAGNSGTHNMQIYKTDGTKVLAGYDKIQLNSTNANTFQYRPLVVASWNTADAKTWMPYRLQANTQYYVMIQEAASGDTYLNTPYAVTPTSAFTVLGAATSTDAVSFATVQSGSYALGGINLIYTDSRLTTADGLVGVPVDDTYDYSIIGRTPSTLGQQTAFITGTGSMSQTFTATKGGHYSIRYWSTVAQHGDNRITFKVDGQALLTDYTPFGDRKSKYGFYFYSTPYFAAGAGSHTIEISGTRVGSNTIFLDGFAIVDMDAYFGGTTSTNMPAAGSATGDTGADFQKKMEVEAETALLWGVVGTTYEGGWHNGDWQEGGVYHWIDAEFGNYAPARAYMSKANENLLQICAEMGLNFYVYYMRPYEDIYTASNYPVYNGVVMAANRWMAEPTRGHAVPSTLDCSDWHYQRNLNGTTYNGPNSWRGIDYDPTIFAGQWKSWLVLAPASARYRMTVECSSGGTAGLVVDGSVTLAEAASDTLPPGEIFLTKGQHMIRIEARSGSFSINRITVSEIPTEVPAAPSALDAVALSSGSVALTWLDNAGNEAGYKIERKTGSGLFYQIATLGMNSTNYIDTGVTGNTVYTYRVRAYNTIGDSSYCAEDLAATPAPVTPAAPSALTATALSASAIHLSWTDNSTNETQFVIERKTGTNDFVQIVSVGADVTIYTDTGLLAGTGYTYRVRARNGDLYSVYSAIAVGTTATRATPLVEEHFTDLNGTGSIGVTGWPQGALTTGLSYPDIVSTNNGLTSATTFGNAVGYNGTGYGDSTVWFSVMVKNTVDQDRLLFFGASGSTAGVGVDFTSTGARADISGTMGNAVTITPANVNLIVGKMVLSSTGNETVTLWVNPSNFSDETSMIASAAGSSTVTAAGAITASTSSKIYPRMAGSSTVFDEIRLASSLDSVVPVSGGGGVSGVQAPAITVQPQNQTVNQGDNVLFSVTATGDAPLSYQWKKGSVNTGSDSATLSLTGVQTNAAGNYTVVVSNSAGSVTSSVAVLTINLASSTDPYDSWAAGYGLSPGSELDESPANDGIRNLMKYALGLQPAAIGFQGHLERGMIQAGGTDYFMLRYIRPEPAPADITYTVAASDRLTVTNWTPGVEVASVVSNDLRIITIRDSLPMEEAASRFIKLNVTKQ